MSIKQSAKKLLYQIRNPQQDDNEKAYIKRQNAVRLLFLLPFLIAAALMILFSFK